ncbi:hypothetical protein BpHYR1_011425 [Brachionus plicatilis]|uniref:Uncharacterized protein n=1 Tax=Brachionus plicatilis TaxID=10195 RepID=A0A3M7RG74_BRAPC|nr:hypothetical protein BpHYR1_011425 [Brachionus plicatilis]
MNLIYFCHKHFLTALIQIIYLINFVPKINIAKKLIFTKTIRTKIVSIFEWTSTKNYLFKLICSDTVENRLILSCVSLSESEPISTIRLAFYQMNSLKFTLFRYGKDLAKTLFFDI